MKSWVLIPLVVFIAVAGYQFGYYRAKLENSDVDKLRISEVMEKGEASFMNVVQAPLQAAELPQDMDTVAPAPPTVNTTLSTDSTGEHITADPLANAAVAEQPSLIKSVEVLHEAAKAEREQRLSRKAFADTFDESQLDLVAATQITDFFELHPKGEKLYLHSVQCDGSECQLIGQFEGNHEDFDAIVVEMKTSDWWKYSGISSNTTSDGAITHFILHLTGEGQQAGLGVSG
ncbi:hypothetical protein CA267_011615 [Alteromonas pelagimontana]|uniref:Uncharacterized protein n=1 Tax=Alteromonas pelagimontana TaxID=1858656 RepID=A0A6M4MES9_9ALTE|nr:hypothetical protein [Alteromonas pelagimontana]QJR81378.1 hypothetical protein CA267_011615 [Alteromonas pelagimontana]